MGADIHFYVEAKNESGTWEFCSDVRFENVQNYGLFGFLADVRNYSAIPYIAEERGLPVDLSDGIRAEYAKWELDAHSASYLLRDELLEFDYDQSFENRRRKIGPDMWDGETVEVGQGEMVTYRKFLPDVFLDDLKKLADIPTDNVRLVFWFDN